MTEEHKDRMREENHHSHHHSHQHGEKKKSTNKFLKFVGKYKKQIAGVTVFLVLLTTLIVVALTETPPEDGQRVTAPTVQNSQQSALSPQAGAVSLQASHYSQSVSVSGEAVQAWMNAPIGADVQDVLASYREGGKRLDVPAPVELKFQVLSLPEKTTVVASKVDVSENEDFSGCRSYDLGAGAQSVELWNLKTGTKYYYRATVYLSDGTAPGVFGSFETAAGPRILNIGGLHNVRDFGGWEAAGKLLPQGLLYRGSEADGAVKSHYKITDEGLNELVMQLGVRTDMDLRAPGVGGAALGASVTYKAYGIDSYMGIFTPAGKAAVGNVFGDLAVRNNYPVYLHSTQGTDRTGTVCFLLGALLGVSEEDLIREYELSALSSADVNRQQLQKMLNQLKTYGGENLKENVQLYLLDVGVTTQQIASIREIWLG